MLMLVVCPLHSQTESSPPEDTGDIEILIKTLDQDIVELKFLIEKISTVEKSDQEVLFYRQDERIFRLLTDFDSLVRKVAELPEDSQQKQMLKAQLRVFGTDTDEAFFERIENINQRVIEYNTQLKDLSGASYTAAQAYIRGLETIRVQYYEAMANHIESRTALNVSSENLQARLEPELYLYSETLAGRIELTGKARQDLKDRLSADPGNPDIDSAMKELNAQHETNLERLEAIILVLDKLKLDSSEYKAVMLQQSSSISISLFSSNALFRVFEDGWITLKKALKENAPDLMFRAMLFLIVLLIFRTLSRITKRLVRATTDRAKLDMSELLRNILISTSGGIVMALGVLMALSQVGVSLAPMLAGLGVAGFIVGFALQDTLGNFAAGAMILIYRPFDVDDFVEVTGASGLVKKMNLVSTTITTFDNQTLVVPNSKIWGDVIKNVTAQTERRVDLVFGIGYGDDIELAENVLADIVASHEKILKDPEPQIKVHTLGDSSVNFVVRPWVKTDDYWDVYWYMTREVKLRFDREGISIPFPQRDVHLYKEQSD